jgi:hypothetical protein
MKEHYTIENYQTQTTRRESMSKIRGFVFYDGPSALDGAPIIGIAVLKSRNAKTGDMIQTFILRADESPLSAIDTCYVDVAKSVQSVYAAWVRGTYPLLSPAQGARMLTGRAVRLGAYGDPASIPARHWRALLKRSWVVLLMQGLRGLEASVAIIVHGRMARHFQPA